MTGKALIPRQRRRLWPARPASRAAAGRTKTPGANAPNPSHCSSLRKRRRSAARAGAGGEHDVPAAVPVAAPAANRCAGRRARSAQALRGQPVQAAPAVRRAVEPALARQPEDARAHQPLVDAPRGEQANQPGQPHGAAVRGDRIAPDGDDQRLAPCSGARAARAGSSDRSRRAVAGGGGRDHAEPGNGTPKRDTELP